MLKNSVLSRASAALLTCLMGLGLVTAASAPAVSAETRTIAGTVALPAGIDAAAMGGVALRYKLDGTTAWTTVDIHNTTGAFTTGEIAPGKYNVCVTVNGLSASQWQNILYTCVDTTDVVGTLGTVDVTAASATSLFIPINKGGVIKGRVILPEGAPTDWYRGMRMFAYRQVSGGSLGVQDWVDTTTGEFVLEGFYPGEYPVQVRRHDFTDYFLGAKRTALIEEAYWGASGPGQPGNIVTIINGNVVSGVDITLRHSTENRHFESSGIPQVIGEPVPGQTLSVLEGYWNPTPTRWTYRWYRDSVELQSGPSENYVVKPEDVNGRIWVEVLAYEGTTRSGHSASDRNMGWISSYYTRVGSPVASGKALLGSTLTCDPGTWSPQLSEPGYRWYRNGSQISTSGKTHVVVEADLKSALYCVVEAYAPSDTTVRRASLRVYPVRPFASQGTVAIAGDTGLNGSLTATVSGFSPAATDVTYQWLRNGVVIDGAAEATYHLAAADYGKSVSVRANVTATGYETVQVSSAQTAVPLIFTTAPKPTFTGTLTAGSTLTASPGTWVPNPGRFTYQWLRNGNAIAGATKATYTLTTADRGKKLAVQVTATRTGVPTVVRTSTSKAVPNVFSAAPQPTIAGTMAVGSTLTAKPGTWTPTPTTLTYQWFRSGVAISGATTKTYKVVKADRGTKITVRATATKSGYLTVTKASAGRSVPN